MTRTLPISATVVPGDYGRDYIRVNIGDCEITVYQSEVRKGGITVEIDGEFSRDEIGVFINDGKVFMS